MSKPASNQQKDITLDITAAAWEILRPGVVIEFKNKLTLPVYGGGTLRWDKEREIIYAIDPKMLYFYGDKKRNNPFDHAILLGVAPITIDRNASLQSYVTVIIVLLGGKLAFLPARLKNIVKAGENMVAVDYKTSTKIDDWSVFPAHALTTPEFERSLPTYSDPW